MTPGLGRIVLYRSDGKDSPAIVVAVSEDGTVNLQVFADAPYPPVWRGPCKEGDGDNEWHWPVKIHPDAVMAQAVGPSATMTEVNRLREQLGLQPFETPKLSSDTFGDVYED